MSSSAAPVQTYAPLADFLNEFDAKRHNYATMSDEELLAQLKKTKEFEQLVFPTSWHKKFPDLPKADCADPKEYIKTSPWMKKHHVYYEGKIVDLPPQPGGNRPVLPAPEVPAITLVQNSFSDAPTNQSETERPQHYPEMKVNSIEPIATKSQE
jgi:hypothetical protein